MRKTIQNRGPHADAIGSYRYTVATAPVKRCVRPKHFLEELMGDPEINRIVGRIQIEELPEADLYCSKLQVTMKDGKEYIEYSDVAKGDPVGNPMTKEEIISKFWHNTGILK